MGNVVNDTFEKKLAETRHRELRDELKEIFRGVTSAISNLKKDDPELKRLIAQNSEAINNFGKIPEVNVEIHQDKVVDAINLLFKELTPILKGFDERLSKLENRPLPVRLRPERSGFPGTINYVTIEYQK